MTIKVKKGGAYVDPVGVFVKKGGAYAAVQGVYAKASGAYRSALAPVNFYGANRYEGNSQMTTGASGLSTAHFKIEAEAPVRRVRVWIAGKSASGTLPNFKALVASSETAPRDTVNNMYLPVSGGTVYNSVVTNGPGWRAVTWDGGAASKVLPLASAAANAASVMCSEWIDCPSLPRADAPGGRPMMLLRVTQDVVGAPYTVAAATANLTTYQGARGLESWFREYFSARTSNDGIATLSNIPANVTQGSGMYAWLEFEYAVKTRSVLVVGESIMQSTASTYAYDNWTRVPLLELSTPSAPISVANIAGSGHSSVQFLTLLDGVLNAGLKPTDVVMPGWSQNGFTPTDAGADTLIALNKTYIDKLRAAGIRVFMTTSYAVTGFTGSAEAARVKCINQVRAWALQGLVTLVETDGIVTDYSGGNGVLKAEYNSGDNVHANAAAQRQMSNHLKAVWQANP